MEMNKYFKRLGTLTLALALAFGVGTVADAKGPQNAKKEQEVQTARTAQERVTGVITENQTTVKRYAETIELSGTVVIDGPQLVVEIPGTTTTVEKIADNTWTYSATVTLTEEDFGDIEYGINAYTIYVNGKPAGDVHTRAVTVSQQVHVPYVTETLAENPQWGDYDAETNKFPLTYDLVKVWSDGGENEVHEVTVDVDADLEVYTVPGTKTTFEVPAKPVQEEVEVVAVGFEDIYVVLTSQNQNQWKAVVNFKVIFSDETTDVRSEEVSGTTAKVTNSNNSHITSHTITVGDVSTTITINGQEKTAKNEVDSSITVIVK